MEKEFLIMLYFHLVTWQKFSFIEILFFVFQEKPFFIQILQFFVKFSFVICLFVCFCYIEKVHFIFHLWLTVITSMVNCIDGHYLFPLW